MMKIKFRAWNKKENVMINSDNMLKICFVGSENTPSMIVYSDRKIDCHTKLKKEDKKYCDDFELMQFTSLTDINAVEIYEGDIVKYTYLKGIVKFGDIPRIDSNNKSGYTGFYIDWVNDEHKLTRQHLSYFVKKDEFKIIGNIYKNKEMLEND